VTAAPRRGRLAGLPPNVQGAVWMMLAAFGFSIMGALVKVLGQRFDSFQIAFFRNLFGFATLLPMIWAAGGLRVMRTPYPGRHLVRILTGIAAMVTNFYALTHLPLATATSISFVAPMFMIVLGVLVLGEKVRWRRWSATLAGFAGIVMMVRPTTLTPDLALLSALANAAFVAVAQVQVKTMPTAERPLTLLTLFSVAATLAMFVPAVLVWQSPTRVEWVVAVLVGATGVLSQGCVIRAFQVGEATAVSPFDYTRLVFATALGAFVFAEMPSAWTFAGAAVVIGSAVYIARREGRLAAPPGSRPEGGAVRP